MACRPRHLALQQVPIWSILVTAAWPDESLWSLDGSRDEAHEPGVSSKRMELHPLEGRVPCPALDDDFCRVHMVDRDAARGSTSASASNGLHLDRAAYTRHRGLCFSRQGRLVCLCAVDRSGCA